MAQTKGDQTVTRAELQAMVIALEARPDSVIYTDCQSNINLWNLVAARGPNAFYMDKANEDLVYRLAKHPRPPQQMVYKVKSHVDSLGVQDHVQSFIHLEMKLLMPQQSTQLEPFQRRSARNQHNFFKLRKMINAP